MSMTSLPSVPSIVIVLRARLVVLKSPKIWTLSPGVPPAEPFVGSATCVPIRISSILSSSAITSVVAPTWRVMTISVNAPRTAMPAASAAALV
jgi:hypothetical protein